MIVGRSKLLHLGIYWQLARSNQQAQKNSLLFQVIGKALTVDIKLEGLGLHQYSHGLHGCSIFCHTVPQPVHLPQAACQVGVRQMMVPQGQGCLWPLKCP